MGSVKQQLKIKAEIEKRKARASLAGYTEYVHKGRWLPAKHLLYIDEKVELLLNGELYDDDGKEVDILLLSMPPQHGKSMTITNTLPSYLAGNYEYTDTIIVAYNSEFAQDFNRKNRAKLKEFGEDLFGVKLTKESASIVELDNHSSMRAVGIEGGITGNPADLIIIDDPVRNRADAYSESTRNKVWHEFLNGAKTRMRAANLSSPRLKSTGKIIVIMTRWHTDDLYGRITDVDGIPYYAINLPVEALENDPLGREPGDPLFPEIGKDKEWLKKEKGIYINDPTGGQSAWRSLFMGNPSAEEGNIFKRTSWGRYNKTKEFINALPVLVMSVDAAFKGKKDNDKVAIQIWGKKGPNIYLVDAVAENLGFTDTLHAIIDILAKYPRVSAKYIEDKANGSAIIEVLNSKIGGFIPVKADVSTGGKVARAYAIEPYVASGNVYLPEEAPWVADFISELADFPTGKYKDQVDAATQALNKLIYFYAEIENKEVDKYQSFYGKKPKDESALGEEIEISDSFINYGGQI